MKKVLLSIQSDWCELIANGNKTLEARKSRPRKIEVPFKCYIYCTKGGYPKDFILMPCWEEDRQVGYYIANKHVIGEFICKEIQEVFKIDGEDAYDISDDCLTNLQMSNEELMNYGKGAPIYLWDISDLEIYKDIVELPIAKAPQSWCYLGEEFQ